jgi:hypothetical protein
LLISFDADRHIHGVPGHTTLVAANVDGDAVEVDDGPDRVEPPLSPRRDIGIEIGGDLRDEGGRHLDPVQFLDHALDVAGG